MDFLEDALTEVQDAVVGQPTATMIWSRTIGALGGGVWRALTALETVVVGCGRSGSLLAVELAHLGVRRMTLIDPDRVEPHNLGEMAAVTREDIGRPKAVAVVDRLRREQLRNDAVLEAIGESVTSLRSLTAIKRADLVVCCVDNPAARLATAYLATVYLKPLVDLGTGIFHETTEDQARLSSRVSSADGSRREREPGVRRMGADVRLILPGRCLVCVGGIGQWERGVEALRRELAAPGGETSQGNRGRPASDPDPQAWRRERAGSLRSLNGLAVHLAVRLVEETVAGRNDASRWLHVEFGPAGLPTLEQRESPQPIACPLCAVSGRGDGALNDFGVWLAVLAERLRHW
jgi:molybdopterin/thiamine biosynthesis adenylyltransferase